MNISTIWMQFSLLGGVKLCLSKKYCGFLFCQLQFAVKIQYFNFYSFFEKREERLWTSHKKLRNVYYFNCAPQTTIS